MNDAMRSGLSYALRRPVGTGYVDFSLGVSQLTGVYGRAEAGYHWIQNVSAFGYGQIDKTGPSAGLGVRVTF